MHRHTSQRGAALILLLGITATLAVLASTLAFVLMNQQRATASDRSSKRSLYASEAALDSAVGFAKVEKVMSTTAEWLTPADLATYFAEKFPHSATVTYRVYDNLATVNYSIKWDQGGPSATTTPDHRVWVEATVTYQGKTTRTRVLLQQTREPFAAALPKAVTYSDSGIRLEDHSDIYAVNADGTPDTSGAPYPTAISAGGTWNPAMPTPSWDEVGRLTLNADTDLAAVAGGRQSLGIKANGSVSLAGTIFDSAPDNTITGAGHTFDDVTIAPGTVGFLSDYFDQAAQSDLADESQAASPAQANASATSTPSTNFRTSRITTNIAGVTYDSATQTYTFANDLVVTGDLTLTSSGSAGSQGVFPSGTTFKFRSLYMAGSLAVTGQISLNTTALYVGKNFTISGASTAVKDWLGSVYVKATPSDATYGGNVNWSGMASVTSRDYTLQAFPDSPAAQPKPMWLGRYWSRTGTYADEYGPIWVPGNSGLSIVFGSTNNSTIVCPLLSTTERTAVSGHIDFGSRTKPMVYFFMCDNNGIYPQVVDWAGTGTFYGLMVINESTIDIRNGVSGTPSIEGAIFAGSPYDPTHTSGMSMSDIVLEDWSSIAFNQTVVGNIATSSLKTTTLVTQVVPGSWQQLSAN